MPDGLTAGACSATSVPAAAPGCLSNGDLSPATLAQPHSAAKTNPQRMTRTKVCNSNRPKH